jgi:dGTPase
VAQIARSIARALHLNEDLTETIALAHDLGHPPFGHAGQDILNRCMREFGGFEHNLQSLRVVDELEERYVEFPGLNLTFESREGILKHCSLSNAKRLGELGVRFLHKMQPGLEAQLVNLADEISYVCHDLDDGLRAGVLDVEQTCSQGRFARTYEELSNRYPDRDQRRLIHETIRRLVDYFVTHLIENCRKGLKEASPGSPDEVRAWGHPLIEHDDAVRKELKQLKTFLYSSLYMHDRVAKMREEAAVILENLFALFMDCPRKLPEQELRRSERLYEELGISGRARAVTDYIAGMTDRYAAQEYRRLRGVDETH